MSITEITKRHIDLDRSIDPTTGSDNLVLSMLVKLVQSIDLEIELPPEAGVPPRVPERDEVFPPDIAKSYVDACGVESNADDHIERAEIVDILQRLNHQLTDTQVLECGTGPGILAKLLMESGGLVTATDVSPTMIELAQQNHAAAIATGRLRFEIAEARELPFNANTFDLVVAKHLLHQLPTGAAFQFLHQVVQVLKVGGVAVIGDYNRLSSRADRDTRLAFTLPEMKPLLEETFDASFTPNELTFLLSQIPGIEFAILPAEDPARLSPELQQKIEDDPVKGHATDWLTRLRVVIRKVASSEGETQ